MHCDQIIHEIILVLRDVLQGIVRAGQGVGQGGRRFGGAGGIGNFVITYGTHAKGKRNNDGGQE